MLKVTPTEQIKGLINQVVLADPKPLTKHAAVFF